MKCGDDGRGGVVAGAGGSMNMFPTLSPAELSQALQVTATAAERRKAQH